MDNEIKLLEEYLESWQEKLRKRPDSYVCAVRIEMLEKRLEAAKLEQISLSETPQL